jgi:hypothetical protein
MEVTMTDNEIFADRYVAVWNEPDPQARRRRIAELWADDGRHLAPSHEAEGYDALEARVARAYEEFVEGRGFVFRRAGPVDAHHGVMRLKWQMVPALGGAVAAVGSDVFLFGPDGRVSVDYQFIEPDPA